MAFFVEGIAVADVVEGQAAGTSGHYDFRRLVQPSGAKALSVIILDPTLKDQLIDTLKSLEVGIEYGAFGRLEMLAIEVSPGTELVPIVEYLEKLERAERLSYAELCIK